MRQYCLQLHLQLIFSKRIGLRKELLGLKIGFVGSKEARNLKHLKDKIWFHQ